jgi:hypothetical protein
VNSDEHEHAFERATDVRQAQHKWNKSSGYPLTSQHSFRMDLFRTR